ncbi:MAG: rhomboid family intramembrane serine protease [Bacteroidetes bacterium]|nr:rhomboid family intramembrane serine protease [Bacteroidota bacterium]
MAEKRKGVFFRELFPFTFVVALWLMHILQGFSHNGLRHLALFPRHTEGLYGIVFHPLLHADFSHLIGNSIPLLVLGLLLFNAYKIIAHRVFFIMYLLTGILVWFFARESWHLGASGLVYGLAAFLFFSGIIRRHLKLMVISMLVVFLYGSMVWGVLPIDPTVSWEGHLFGALTGMMLAWVYRREGPQRQVYWQDEPEDDNEPLPFPEELPDFSDTPQPPPPPADPIHPHVNITYWYRDSKDQTGNAEK